jgi:ABC-type transport system involved in cytochrome c biogenesis permease subunit
MATRATQIRVEQQLGRQPAKTGNGLLIVVGLGTAFLLFMAFLNVAKSGSLFTESNLLFGSLIFYAAAAALYIGFGVSAIARYVKVASAMMLAGWVFNTLAAAHRWYSAGHPPFASVYEMLLSFVWTLAVLTQFAERKYGVKLIGSVTMPIAVTSVILMQLLPSDVHPLVPALQSTWLHVHVTLAMLAYAACALSFALAIMFLIKDSLRTETFMALSSAMSTLIYGGLLAARFSGLGGLSVVAWDYTRKEEIFIQRGTRLFVTIPELGWLFLLAFAAVAAPLVIYALAKLRKQENFVLAANRAVFIAILMQLLALGVFIVRSNNGLYASADAEGIFPTSLAASPFILSGIIGSIFSSLLYLMLYWRREDLERLLPSSDALDRITYKTIGVAFPLLTLMIAAGAYWANRTWGSYWSWDPKETWAAITWLVYAGYLHMRITRGWRGRRAAYFAIIGFGVVMFTFFGVTYLLPGLHAYA